MAELTKEVIERVAAELQSRCHFKEIETSFRVAEAIIPLAQLPWDDPTKEEAESFHEDYYTFASTSIPSTLHALVRFIRYRNSAPQPKPVDPRLEKIRSALVYHAAHRFNQLITPNQFDEAALAVLTALNEVK